jgi:predicted NAD/FAD-dependent oxidoreductase
MSAVREIIVIGAGAAGLAAASQLRKSGNDVLVIDKGRGVGGRLATRRVGALRMDHGAQFFTVRDRRFSVLVAPLMDSGEVFEWWRGPGGEPRYACRSGMSALAKVLSQGLDLALGDAVTAVTRTDSGVWEVMLASGAKHRAGSLIVNTPPAQLLPLVGTFLDAESRSRMAGLEMAPTWAVFGEVDRDPELGGVALEFHDHPIFRFIARDHTRRPPGQGPSLLVHCSDSWSSTHLEEDPISVAAITSKEIESLLGVRFTEPPQVHRWKFATPIGSYGEGCFWNPELRLGACGDWFTGGRVEGALVSGWSLAEKI